MELEEIDLDALTEDDIGDLLDEDSSEDEEKAEAAAESSRT